MRRQSVERHPEPVYAVKVNQMHLETPTAARPGNLVGTWRRFGSFGPVYEIVGLGEDRSDGDRWMRIRVLETGEELDYRLADVLGDPKEG